MPRHIACLTFDFDTWSSFAVRGMTTPTPISRGEFGLVGAKRILALMAKYGIRTTWFVPGIVIDTYPEACAEIVAAGHEIAHHGYTHELPAAMDAEREEREMLRAIECIRRLTGRAPRGYRSAAWDLSDATLDLLLKHGFDYESSMMGHDHQPYFVRQGDVVSADEPMRFGKQTRLVELPISWSLDDHPHFEFLRTKSFLMPGLQAADGVLKNFTDDFVYMTREETDWGALTYTFHPYVVGRGHRMLLLERLILALQEMGASFMAMEDLADEWLGRQDARAAAQ
ncbi:polysaccharide deacetylase [Marinibaculum pumilum]|uniref:Chitooligosaccharide deacetylase n=1 Tax=Marinibaculum pumilum TaxID=1766165 RepID=A0ABV7L4M7_9PROT